MSFCFNELTHDCLSQNLWKILSQESATGCAENPGKFSWQQDSFISFRDIKYTTYYKSQWD